MLLGIGDTLAGRLLLFDALETEFTELKLRRDPNCPVCSDAAVAARAGRPPADRSTASATTSPFAADDDRRWPARSRPRRAHEHGLHPGRAPRRTSAAPSRSSSTATRSAASSTRSWRSTRRSAAQLLTEDGDLNRFVNVYVNGQDVRYLAGLDTPGRAGRRGPAAAGDGRGLTDGRPVAARDDAEHDHAPRPRGAGPARRAIRRHPRGDRPHAARRDPADVARTRTSRIFAKLEMLNPTGSVKDRVAKYLVEDLERARPPPRGLDHPRADVGQHRDRPGDDRPAQGLPRRAGHARQRHQRAAPDGRAVRGRGDRLPGRARLERGDRAGQAPRLARTSAS